MRISSEPNFPILDRADAELALKDKGYVRMDGHTATDERQLAELYDVILPAKEAGTYGRPQDPHEALRVRLETAGHFETAQTSTPQGQPVDLDAFAAAIRSETEAKYKLQEAENEAEDLRKQIEDLKAQPGDPGQPDTSKAELEQMAENAIAEAEASKAEAKSAQEALVKVQAELEKLKKKAS